MRCINAQILDYKLLISNPTITEFRPYPLFRNDKADKLLYVVSPQHGRSYVVGRSLNGRWIITKGNGLSYTQKTIIQTPELPLETWGVLYEEAAMRDYFLGNEIASLGIKTNNMEAVLEIDLDLPSDIKINKKPVLLQYSVECPYRISDYAFIHKNIIQYYISKWKVVDEFKVKNYHEFAANVLIRNLYLMHQNNILHNALTTQNITWALELLDFELSCSPSYPYSKEEEQRCVSKLFSREILHVYQIILDIAGILKEIPNYYYLDRLFENYGFNI